jgi:hypothetical protein
MVLNQSVFRLEHAEYSYIPGGTGTLGYKP